MDENGRRMVAVILVAIMAVAVLAVAFTSGFIKSGTTGSVLDAAGRDVTMDSPPERIVSCSPSLSEMVAALGLADKLVAVTQYCDYPEAVNNLNKANKIVGGFYTPNYESVVSYRPDLVLVAYDIEAHRNLANRLIESGINVVQMFPEVDLRSAYVNIGLLGNVTGTYDKALEIIESMKNKIRETTDTVANYEKKNVMYIPYADKSFEGIFVAGKDTAVNEIITLAGGNNIFDNANGWQRLNPEELTLKGKDIDCIIITVMSNDNAPDPNDWASFFERDQFLSQCDAVKNNAIFYLYGQAENIFNRQSVRMADAIQLMAHMLYPEELGGVPYHEDGEPNEIGDEYLEYLPEQNLGAQTFYGTTAVRRV
ncbi:MAG TPA: ABC transporter substrate-binding protein [Euryarchaeota archaeon]|nr:ABC transporter substrate-binding protein [Euryarchaeota archaeon]